MLKELTVTLKEIIALTYNVKSFRLNVPDGVEYKAGQFMSVSLGEGKAFTRYLTMSSAPTEKGYL